MRRHGLGLRRAFAAASALALGCVAQAQVIHDNGPLSTGPVTKSGVAAPAGTAWSEVQNDAGNLTESNTTAGFTVAFLSATTGFRLADDFTIPPGETWVIDRICLYSYQTGTTPGVSPFIGTTLRIWNGRPGDPGSVVIHGDTVTNRLVSSVFSGLYRIFNTQVPPPGTVPGTTRPMFKNEVAVGTVLGPGTYWLDWQSTVNGNASHFHPSVTIVGDRGLPGWNARQFSLATGLWVDAIDTGNPAAAPDVPQDLAFQVKGTVVKPFSVDGFFPPQGGQGDIITILGTGFGNNPDNICAVVMNGDEAVPLTAISATDTEIKVVVGPVAPNAQPGPIMVGLGQGDRDGFMPAFPHIVPENPDGVWFWQDIGGPKGMTAVPFLPIPDPPPPPGQRWFYGEVVDGRLCLFIDGDWKTNSEIVVYTRMHNHTLGIGADLLGDDIRIRLQGDAQKCAFALADVIECAFGQHGVNAVVNLIPVGPNTWKLEVTLFHQGQAVPIEWGMLNVCVTDPPCIPTPWDVYTPFFNAQIALLPGDQILVSNLGGTGLDGVSITGTMPQDKGVKIDVELIQLHLVGERIGMRAWGSMNGQPDRHLGMAGVHRVDSFFDVFADFSDIGATQSRVQVYDDGVLSGEVIVPTGLLGKIEAPGLICNGLGKLGGPFLDPPCFWIDFDNDFLFIPNEQPPIPGDELRILAHNAQGNIDFIQQMDVSAALDEGQFVIRHVGKFLECYPDCENDGDLDVFDYLCFLNLYGQQDPYADCEQDGDFDVFDYLCFLNLYGEGCVF